MVDNHKGVVLHQAVGLAAERVQKVVELEAVPISHTAPVVIVLHHEVGPEIECIVKADEILVEFNGVIFQVP
ncbi:hypothetical protein ES703_40368 [subsurface metagenome]